MMVVGGFESAFFTNLVAAYILDNSRELFLDTIYDGIYRDDELTVMGGNKTIEELIDWLHLFQAKLNEMVGSDHLKFTMEIWDTDAPVGPDPEKPKTMDDANVSIIQDKVFPFLHMKLY